jgi:hypothetical protein
MQSSSESESAEMTSQRPMRTRSPRRRYGATQASVRRGALTCARYGVSPTRRWRLLSEPDQFARCRRLTRCLDRRPSDGVRMGRDGPETPRKTVEASGRAFHESLLFRPFRFVPGRIVPPVEPPVTPEVAGSSPVAPVSRSACKMASSVVSTDERCHPQRGGLLSDGISLSRLFGVNHLQTSKFPPRESR